MTPGERLPPTVHANLTDTVKDYWFARVAQHEFDWYAGVRLLKFPEDLRVYEHLIWLSRASVVIEIGARFGGSALWFRDRLRTLQAYGLIERPLVVSIDIEPDLARAGVLTADPSSEGIEVIGGDVTDPELPDRVAALVPEGASCLVIEDSAHVYDTTLAALEGFTRFVPPGGFFVVEDGCVDVDELRLKPDWPRGVLPALHDWLATEQGSAFTVREDLELYGMSCHPGGFLQRTQASA
ncbi:MAG TPA: CmcI family methyltransferase [Solirubrobacteraceae bacterium]|nr:CmcI family methyltransferase [Solirubrobacteraceae bacterium]